EQELLGGRLRARDLDVAWGVGKPPPHLVQQLVWRNPERVGYARAAGGDVAGKRVALRSHRPKDDSPRIAVERGSHGGELDRFMAGFGFLGGVVRGGGEAAGAVEDEGGTGVRL